MKSNLLYGQKCLVNHLVYQERIPWLLDTFHPHQTHHMYHLEENGRKKFDYIIHLRVDWTTH